MPSAYVPSLGGVEELTRHLALDLTQVGCKVEIWAPGPGLDPHATTETLDGITVRRFRFPLPGASPRAIFRFAIRFPLTL